MSKVQIPALFHCVFPDTTTLPAQGVSRSEKPKACQPAMQDIHFGNMILSELREQRRSVAWFAKEMGSDRSNMYKLLARQHLNSEFIFRASKLLNHDFFGDASALFLLDESCGKNNDKMR